MKIIVNNLMINIEEDSPPRYITALAEKLALKPEEISLIKILAKALDSSDETQFRYKLSVAVKVPDSFRNKNKLTVFKEEKTSSPQPYSQKDKPLIIGMGPAGLFAAIELVDRGSKPILFERGKAIEERSADIDNFISSRILNTESNIQFGEGGAGSYSDGKLFTRINNSQYANKVLATFIRFGAPPEIAYTAKPHLGTDVLCRIVRNMREFLLERGAQLHYSSKMTELIIRNGAAEGIVINGKDEYLSSTIFLALGNSARDSFAMLHGKGLGMESKPIAVGMRLEHPAEIINLIRYGKKYQNNQQIGAATYSFTYTDHSINRGVYSFCMCPGGEIVNAASENGLLAVNGMSYSDRGMPFSNSAITVNCRTSDYLNTADPFAGIEFQKEIERKAFEAGGRNWKAPAQKVEDFLAGRESASLNTSSYKMSCSPADMRAVFPDFICHALSCAFRKWKEDYPLFISEHGMLIGAETRTSSPVKFPRKENGESINVKNLYPIGEGSGYTGGITSAALDALRAVDNMLMFSSVRI